MILPLRGIIPASEVWKSTMIKPGGRKTDTVRSQNSKFRKQWNNSDSALPLFPIASALKDSDNDDDIRFN